jgi:hypothetical protein
MVSCPNDTRLREFLKLNSGENGGPTTSPPRAGGSHREGGAKTRRTSCWTRIDTDEKAPPGSCRPLRAASGPADSGQASHLRTPRGRNCQGVLDNMSDTGGRATDGPWRDVLATLRSSLRYEARACTSGARRGTQGVVSAVIRVHPCEFVSMIRSLHLCVRLGLCIRG